MPQETFLEMIKRLFKNLFAGTGQSKSARSVERRVGDEDLRLLLDLYENEDFFDAFIAEVAATGADDSETSYLRRHFPRGNWIKQIIQEMAYGLPMIKVRFLDAEGVPLEDTRGEDGKLKKNKEKEDLDSWLRRKFDVPGWEGNGNFWSAIYYWRELIFLTGRMVVKIIAEVGTVPEERKGDAEGKYLAVPQRIPQLASDYILSEKDRKMIVGWLFSYSYMGGSEGSGASNINVREAVNQVEWLRWVGNASTAETTPLPAEWGFVPVSYMAWEMLEGEPMGKPYGMRIYKKILNILSTLFDIRNANRKSSDPVDVIINADLPAGTRVKAGGQLHLNAKMPGEQVDYKKVGLQGDLNSLFKELDVQLRDLRADAQLPPVGQSDLASSDPSSGKAIQSLSAKQIKYRMAYMTAECAFWQDLIWKMSVIEGKGLKREQILVEHEPIMPPDSQTLKDDSDFFANNGMLKEAMRRRGVEEDRVDSLMVEKEDQADKAAEAMLKGSGMEDAEFDGEGNPIKAKPKPKVKPEDE